MLTDIQTHTVGISRLVELAIVDRKELDKGPVEVQSSNHPFLAKIRGCVQQVDLGVAAYMWLHPLHLITCRRW